MLSTLPLRLRNIRLALKFKTQGAFAVSLGVKNGAISRWENEKLPDVSLPAHHFEELVRRGVNPNYILGLEDKILLREPNKLEEPNTEYKVENIELVTERFLKQMKDYSVRKKLNTQKEIAKHFEIGEHTLSKLMNGRDVGIDLLYSCGRKMKIDFNYTMYGEGSMYFMPRVDESAEIVRLKKIIDRLLGEESKRIAS